MYINILENRREGGVVTNLQNDQIKSQRQEAISNISSRLAMHLHLMYTASCKMLSFSAKNSLVDHPQNWLLHARQFCSLVSDLNHPAKYWLTYYDKSRCIAYNYDWD